MTGVIDLIELGFVSGLGSALATFFINELMLKKLIKGILKDSREAIE
jgi:hypothetical protein